MALSPEFMRQITTIVAGRSGKQASSVRVASVFGGDINACYRLSINGRDYFLKTNSVDRLWMFEAEMAALNEITRTGTVRVPLPICTGVVEGQSFLALEWLELHPLDGAAAGQFGRVLAALHRHTAEQFGWYRNNTIGTTPQTNTFATEWISFWKSNRLGFQLDLAARQGYTGRVQELGERLLKNCDRLFSDYTPAPSLLHGDLWRGNTACSAAGQPIIFDPASYYGDREADLAMTALFGGFPDTFMASYSAAWPIDEGYGLRRDFYNIYHLLNHLNLFGRGYLAQSEALMHRVLTGVGA